MQFLGCQKTIFKILISTNNIELSDFLMKRFPFKIFLSAAKVKSLLFR